MQGPKIVMMLARNFIVTTWGYFLEILKRVMKTGSQSEQIMSTA